MQGVSLLVTFLVLALLSAAAAAFVGILMDNLPDIHDYFSLLVFFATGTVLLILSWILAVRLTEPRHGTHA
ncbi:MAG: hypothetical protein OJK14_07385 [Achromobacter sp.]|uniref:hypothetical protein n=1 Tax=Achromobacter sp. TaxID=134375 RepID=UPI002589BC43|nr:hypothetical protein [Achromobacter sp.]MCW0206904.1 hypothetical protein [Achromobacter sp.]